MYKIYADNTLIYDSTLDDYKIGKGTISLEINKSGSFTFSVYPDHFYYDSFVRLKTVIKVYRSDKIVFRGRILNDVTDYWNNKVITCEGELGFLQDSIIRPFTFNGSPVDLFKKFVDEHNSQVDDFKKFKIGTVTVAESNDYIARSNSEYESALSNLNSRLIEDSLGGFFYITHGDDGTDEIPTLNYLADSIKTASQIVEFGSNLKNYTKTVKVEELATAIIPLGKDDLTISGVNSGRDYVYSAEGVALYGWIFKAVSWDDVTNASNLKTKAQAYLNSVVTQNVTVELNAIDLHLLDKSIESFNVCDYVRVISKPHNFDSTLLCNRQTLDLLKPENDSLILGYAKSTITGRTNEVSSSIKALQSKTKTITSSVQKINDDYVKSSQLTAKVDTYLNSDAGKAVIESTLSGSYVTKNDLTGYVEKTELSTSIGQYIDTQAGTAKIVSAVEGTFVKEDTLGNYIEKTKLSAEIGSYIDTAAGTAKIVSAVSGTYQKKTDMSGYVTTTNLNTSIGQYIDTQAGTAKITQAISGTYVSNDNLTNTLGDYAKKDDIPSLDGYLLKSDLNSKIDSYVDTATGKAKIVSAVSGTYVTQTSLNTTLSDYATNTSVNNTLKNYTKTTDLNAGIETYISGSEGKAKIVSAVSGTYVTQSGLNTTLANYATTDDLDDYLAKTELNANIETYVDTEAGKAKIVSAVSGTYVANTDLTTTLANYALKGDIPSLDGYLLKSEVNSSIKNYIDTTSGKAAIVSAVSGTYVTQTNFNNTLADYPTETELNTTLTSYVKTTNLNSSIGTYIDSTTGKAKVVSAVSGTYQTVSGMSEYTKSSDFTKTTSDITQSVSNVEAAITLSSTYTKNTIGTNVYALLQLVSNANSSNIKLKADKIDFTGFTTFLKASDLGSSGSTTIDGGRITTGTISADRIDVSNLKVNTIYGNGSYSSTKLLSVNGVKLYLGGTTSNTTSSDVYITASTAVTIGTTAAIGVTYVGSGDTFRPIAKGTNLGGSSYPWGDTYIGANTSGYHWKIVDTCITPSTSSASSGNFSIGSSSYPVYELYTKALTLSKGGSVSFAGSAVTMGGSDTYYIQATTSRELCPNASSSYYPFYLGTSSKYWDYAYIGSTQTIIGKTSSSKLGFFGSTGAARQTVSSSATVATLITALKAYGLIY